MQEGIMIAIFAVEFIVIDALFLALPRIGRRGLLFGVYVGEERSGSAPVRDVYRAWNMGMVWTSVLAGALFLAVAFVWDAPQTLPLVTLLLVLGLCASYVVAHFKARKLAAPVSAPALAVLDDSSASATLLPLLTLAIVVLAGGFVLGYAVLHYDEMPKRIPVHFDATGHPDGWKERSMLQVTLLPLLTLVLGGFMGTLAWMMLHAKRSLRYTDDPTSARAQGRFRLAISRFLCGITILLAIMFALMGVAQVDVARGLRDSLGWFPLLFLVVIPVYSLGSMVYIMVRYGQGGARMEGRSSDAALTDGLADNRYWKLGLFYVNPEDPSIFVEKRFGLGYTINLGNWKAVALFGVFFVLLFGLVVAAIVAG